MAHFQTIEEVWNAESTLPDQQPGNISEDRQ